MPVLSHQNLVGIIRGPSPIILGTRPIKDDQIQMASVDLALGTHVYCITASGLPTKGECIDKMLHAKNKYDFSLSTKEDKILHKGQTYLIPLNERLRLPKNFSAKFSPKSSIGRIDVLVRVLANGVSRFDHVPEQYDGPLYLEVSPLSFDIRVRAEQSFVQMRIRNGLTMVGGDDLRVLHSSHGIVWGKNGKPLLSHMLEIDTHGLHMHVDFDREIFGFVAKVPIQHVLTLSRINHDPYDYFVPLMRNKERAVTIYPGQFYLFATKELIKIPPKYCGDIAPYDASEGEFRSHYAGFFDPGFGGSKKEDRGTVGVMEVRGREIPFEIKDNQPICRMDFEEMDEIPDLLYGKKNHYTSTLPSLSKYFSGRDEIWKE